MKKIIGLCMTVKNESEVILRCLESVRPIVDYVLVEDTGSTDGTQKIIREWLDRVGLPGEVYDEPWRDFAYNWSHALARLREKKDVDYALINKAGDVLEVPPGFKMPYLKADSYTLEVRQQELRHWRPQLVLNALPWRYEGVLHEFLSCQAGPDSRSFPEERSQNRLPGVRIRVGEESALYQIPASERYRGDCAILENALATETDPFLIARYTFYLAQSYRDCSEREEALANYLKRAELGFWDQEVFISIYQAANLKADLGYDAEDVLASYSKAHKVRHDRVEALHGAARFCRIKGRFEDGYKFAKRALGMKVPADALFVEPWVYDYGVLDEYAVTAYWIGKYDDCRRACKRLLREGKIPADMRDRIEQNARLAREKMSPRVDTKDEGTKTNAEAGSDLGDQAAPRRGALCLNMIVKNEIANLERCLGSVAPYISCWVIGDTGSSDGTQEFIRSFFASRGVPGELHSFPFEDFAQARNEALRLARASALPFDYILLTDADMEMTVENPAFAENLTSAAYNVLQRSMVSYWNIRLLQRTARAGYKGVTHELLDVPSGKIDNLEGVSFIDHGTIEREQKWGEGGESNGVDKYERDVRLLTNALATERDAHLIARYTFYLANTYRDSGQKEAALKTYLDRANLGGWDQEVFLSLLGAAFLKEALGYSTDEVLSAYTKAAAACPTRAEALHGAARFCRQKGFYERGYEFATKGLAIAYPTDALFVCDWIYQYGLLDELAVCAYWTERYDESVSTCDRLLSEGKLPAHMRDRILKNKNFAAGKQQESLAASSAESAHYLKLLHAAREKEGVGGPSDEVIAAYLEAAAACPTHAEALHGAARYCRQKNLYDRGYEFAAKGLAIAHPNYSLPVEDWIYQYGLLDELAVCAYWTERYDECVSACDRLLSEGTLPVDQRDRVLKNKQFAIAKLQENAPVIKTNTGEATQTRLAAPLQHGHDSIGRSSAEKPSSDLKVGNDCLVPAKIFQTWKSKHDIPENYAIWTGTFSIHNPDFERILWDDEDNSRFISENFSWFLQTYRSYPFEIYRADVIRYFFLYTFGGIYADMDVECLRPLRGLLSRGDVLLGRMGSDPQHPHSIPNAIMASKPRQEFWLLVIWLLMNVAKHGGSPENMTGPVLLKSAVDLYLANDPQWVKSVVDEVARCLPPGLRPVAGPSRVVLLANREWFAVDWTDPIHQILRRRILGGDLLSDTEKRDLFPESWMVTYWTHNW